MNKRRDANSGIQRISSHLSTGASLALYARYLCSRDALGLKALGRRPSAARDDRVSCIQSLAINDFPIFTEGP